MTAAGKDSRIRSSQFRPPTWLRNRHAQTIYPSLPGVYRWRPRLRREILELPDGDATAIDWLDSSTAPEAPILVVLHGLESSSRSPYTRMLLREASTRGWHGCVLHFRDCGDFRNRLERRYHAGDTGDLGFFLARLAERWPSRALLTAGYSLGGNVMLKYLGEAGSETPVRAAAAVCVPMDLSACADALNSGFSKIYQRYLLRNMKRAVARKYPSDTQAFDWHRAIKARTFTEFDDAVTAPLHGFDGVADYYERSSSIRYLARIRVPSLILNSRDDPFMAPGALPAEEDLSDSVCLEVSQTGGHVGFVSGGTPWRPEFYLPPRLLGFLDEHADR